MTFGRFLLALLVVCAAASAALPSDLAAPRAALLGVSVALFNAVVFHALTIWGRKRSNRAFMRATLAGMTLRLVAVPVLVALILTVIEIPAAPFAGALLASLAVLLVVETAVVYRLTAPGAAA